MYMEKIISVKLFFFSSGGLVEKCYIGFFPVHNEDFYNCVSCTIFHPFFRCHFLKKKEKENPVIHVYIA